MICLFLEPPNYFAGRELSADWHLPVYPMLRSFSSDIHAD
jgi:hypothetical protein